MLRAPMDRQHARIDGQCKQKEGNPEKQIEMLEIKRYCDRNEELCRKPLIGLSVDWTQLRKQYLLRI